jgi:hypothetical protein
MIKQQSYHTVIDAMDFNAPLHDASKNSLMQENTQTVHEMLIPKLRRDKKTIKNIKPLTFQMQRL